MKIENPTTIIVGKDVRAMLGQIKYTLGLKSYNQTLKFLISIYNTTSNIQKPPKII